MWYGMYTCPTIYRPWSNDVRTTSSQYPEWTNPRGIVPGQRRGPMTLCHISKSGRERERAISLSSLSLSLSESVVAQCVSGQNRGWALDMTAHWRRRQGILLLLFPLSLETLQRSKRIQWQKEKEKEKEKELLSPKFPFFCSSSLCFSPSSPLFSPLFYLPQPRRSL